MRSGNPVLATDPLHFGRKQPAPRQEEATPILSADDVRLFVKTFVAGFAFVAVLIA